MNRKIIILLIIATAVFIAGVQDAMSRQSYLSDFKQKYPETAGTRIDSCVICHLENPRTDTFPRNPYGAAYGNSGNFTLIESKDSDNDGFSNIQEIRNLTFPGDAQDKPGSLKPNITNTTPTPIQTTVVPTAVQTTVIVSPTPTPTTVSYTHL